MSTPARARALLALTAVLAACQGKPAPIPPVAVSATADTLVLPVARVTSAIWLGGDRWAAVAATEHQVLLADVAARTSRPLARSDERLRNPASAFRAGDTLYVADWGLRQLSLWTLDGAFVRAIAATDALRGALPGGRDPAGRFYFELAPPPGRDGRGNRDSGVVVRTGPAFDAPDTVARLSPADIAEVAGDAGRRFERRALSGTDRWGVAPDGALWLARVFHNQVERIGADGRRTRGPELPDRVLQVTDADRAAFVAQFPEELRSTAEQLPFAIVKPPFEGALGGPDGAVWLEKSMAATDSTRELQRIGAAGTVERAWALPTRGRVVGVALDQALVAERFADGVRLLRFALPAAPAPTTAP